MKKSKLIELLQQIDGDPDILLWNGMVQDWMDIRGLEKVVLERQTVVGYSHYLNLERVVRDQKEPYSLEECKKFYKKSGADQWEIPIDDPEFNEHRKQDYDRKFLAKKTAFVFDAKPRGVKTWDRIGDVSY